MSAALTTIIYSSHTSNRYKALLKLSAIGEPITHTKPFCSNFIGCSSAMLAK